MRHKDRARHLLFEKEVRQNTVVFADTEIVTVMITAKMRSLEEAKRLLVRIFSKP